MDAIKTYLDNVFTAFPQTERVRALKREMLTSMEEKYHALKQEGKSEHEAVGGVIVNFGSIDEISAELGIIPGKDEQEDILHLSGEDARAYLNQTKKSSRFIGLGVWIILLGVSALLLLDLEVTGAWNWEVTPGVTSIFVLFLAIAAAVPIFIVNGIKLSRFGDLDEHRVQLDTPTRTEIDQERIKFTPVFATLLSVGVALILLAVGVFVFLSEAVGVVYKSLPAVLLLNVIGFSVFMFITAGMVYSAYDVLVGKSTYVGKKSLKTSEKLISTIASVYWPLMVAVYLAWSFIGEAWGRSWIIWPIAGVAFGAIAGGISTWHETKRT